MTQNNKSIYLCMLDNVNLEENVKLGEFQILYLNTNEIKRILRFSENDILSIADQEQLRTYEQFPWASVEKEISQKDAEDSTKKIWVNYNLRLAHAGIMNWWPFTELIRTLNLARPSLGPIMCRHFYHIPFANLENSKDVEKVIYAEPSTGTFDEEGTEIQPLLFGYTISQEMISDFIKMRTVLNNCISQEKSKNNSHILTAIHHFENGDKNIVAYPLEGSFNAIDPLMSYEAALESLVIREEESGIEDRLASRIAPLYTDKSKEVENFLKRTFWLRSKVAHGGRPIEEIERLIISKPNDEILDEKRRKRIPTGNYSNILLKDGSYFPGFLINLREITRFVIWFFCNMYESGYNKEETIKKLIK